MIDINIQEQKNWLKSKFIVELLTSNDNNKIEIQKFTARKQGKNLELFLKKFAWEEDINGGTKVYLVKDIETGAIVFFFALKAGLLYKSTDDDNYNLNDQEREIVNLCIEYELNPTGEFTTEDVLGWYDEDDLNKDLLRQVIQEKTELKLDIKSDQRHTGEEKHILRVSKTFPGIVLTHFCRNSQYSLSQKITFPLGFYIFWEIIVEQILKINSILGCKYLYLFAADQTETIPDMINLTEIKYGDFYDNESELSEDVSNYNLVNYYKTELKFREVQNMTILKPHYDFECFSLIQPIKDLVNNRYTAWIEHSDIDSTE